MPMTTKLRAARIVLLLCAVITAPVLAKSTVSPTVKQTALVFRTQDVQDRQLPDSMLVAGLPIIYGTQVSLACMTLPAWKDNLVVFLPAQSACMPLTSLYASGQGIQVDQVGFGGQLRHRTQLAHDLEGRDFVIIKTRGTSGVTPPVENPVIQAEVCSCPNNTAPSVSVTSGLSQQVNTGTTITTIGFSASDADSEILNGYFSHTLNDGSNTTGLPAGLSSNCTPGNGILNCTVSGTAPTIVGVYLITLEVMDGFNRVTKTASLKVVASRPPGGITVSTISADTSEDGASAIFNVVLDNAPSHDVRIDLSSSDTSEGIVAPASLTFTSSNWATPQSAVVSGVDDMLIDGTVAYTIITHPAISSDAFYAGINAADVSVSNLDNDLATGTRDAPIGGIPLGSANSCDGNEVVRLFDIGESFIIGDLNVGFTADHSWRGDIRMSLQSPRGVVKVLTDSTGGGSHNYDILLNDDEGGLLNSGSDDDTAAPYYDRIVLQTLLRDFEGEQASGTWIMKICDSVMDEDVGTYRRADLYFTARVDTRPPAGISVSDVSSVTSENGATANFSMSLDSAPEANVSIDLTSSDPGEGVAMPSSLVFTPGNWRTPQQVNVIGVDDTIEDGTVAYTIITQPSVSSDMHYNGIDATDVRVFNIDNEAAGIGCNREFVELDEANLLINVKPSGLDDTQNVQCALDFATEVGMPVVKLAKGTFNVSYLFAERFNGSLQGTTRASTTLNIIDGSIDCTFMESQGLTPSAIKFSQGEPAIKFMQITAYSPCISGKIINNLIHFTGKNAHDPGCGFSVINGRVDRVDIIGAGRGGKTYIAIAASAEGEVLGGCNTSVLGGIKVNFSSISDTTIGVMTAMRSGAQIDINFTTFRQPSVAVLVLNSNQSLTALTNVFEIHDVDPAAGYAAGILVTTNVEGAPAKTRLVIHNNKFYLSAMSSPLMDAVNVSNFAGSTQDVSVSVTKNVFDLEGANIAGFWGDDVDNATVSANDFVGYGYAAVGLEVSKKTSVSGSTISANTGLTSFTGTPADIVIGAGVMNTFVGPQGHTIINNGSGTILSSTDPIDDNPGLQWESNHPASKANDDRTADISERIDRLLQLPKED